MTALDDPFRDVHRARAWAACGRVVLVVTALAVGASLVSIADAVPASPAGAVSASVSPVGSEPLTAPPAEQVPVAVESSPTAIPAVPAEAPTLPSATAAPTSVIAQSPASWSIEIDTTGYQVEVDQCLWVRMNLGGHAPIVGAHNYCGGDVVLDMVLGDQVVLAGAELDATYVVSDERDARAGDSAPAAIDGMIGDVIVQTCYWGGDGRVRLVGLTRVPTA
jgi:hypothetical protein